MIFNALNGCRWSIAACLFALLLGCGGGGGPNDPILGVPVSITKAPDLVPGTTPTPTVTVTTPTGTVTVNPTVLETFPADGDELICPEDPLSAKFSEPMDAATITADTFLLTFINGSGVVQEVEAAQVDYDAATQTASFQPVGIMASGAQHTATIKSGVNGVKNLAGVSLANDFVWTFRTRSIICN
jgi:Bacterial Ig-like domain